MSLRVDTSSLISGALVCGDRGLGVLGSDVPGSGESGAGYLYNDLSSPADDSKEVCGRITSWPSAGTLFAYEDSSFDFTGAPDGSYTFAYQLYVDGVATGSPETVYLNVGATPVTSTNSQQSNQSSTAAILQTHLLGVSGSQQSNQSSTAAILQTHLLSSANSTQSAVASNGSVSQSSIAFVSGSNSAQANVASAAAIQQTQLVSASISQTGNVASSAAVVQSAAGDILVANAQQINQCSVASIAQTHLVLCASSQQANRCSSVIVGAPVYFVIPSARTIRAITGGRRPAAIQTTTRR